MASRSQVPAGRPRRSDARRNIEAIIESAGRLLATNPRASMQDVAEDAGVHRATVHRHFATRDDLVRAVRERALDDFAGLQGDPALQQMPPGAALEQLTRATLELGDRNRIYRVTAAFDDATDARGEELVTPLAALIERAQQAGSVRIDLPSRTLASAWAGLVLVALPQVAGAMSYDEGVSFVLALLRR